MLIDESSLTFNLLLCLCLFLILFFFTGGGQVSLEVHVQQVVLIKLPAESCDPVVIRFIPRQLDLLTSSRYTDVSFYVEYNSSDLM